jgi:hypothetical protein
LFKKLDESLESSNCGEVEQTASNPTPADYSPEDIQSDLNMVPVSSSPATEDDRHLAAIPENSEEAISNVITPADCYSDACNASDAQCQVVEVPAAEVRWANCNWVLVDYFYAFPLLFYLSPSVY